MDKENLDLKTAIQIAKIVVTVPENRMPIIWDIFSQAGLDIGGLDEMAEWKALTKQAFLIDTEKFITGITAGREPVSGEYRILVSDFNEYCAKQKLSARCTRKHLAGLEAIRTESAAARLIIPALFTRRASPPGVTSVFFQTGRNGSKEAGQID